MQRKHSYENFMKICISHIDLRMPLLTNNKKVVSDTKGIAASMNSYFINVCQYLGNRPSEEVSFIYFVPIIVKNLLN